MLLFLIHLIFLKSFQIIQFIPHKFRSSRKPVFFKPGQPDYKGFFYNDVFLLKQP